MGCLDSGNSSSAGSATAVAADDAKAHYQKATAHFAVGEYHDAAIEYEEAFKLKQDPAILFNAAQSFRLAGDNQKALLLYNNIIKLYPSTQYAKDSKERIEKLAQSDDRAPGGHAARAPRHADRRPPATPSSTAPPAARSSPRPPAPGASAMVVSSAAAEHERSASDLHPLVVLDGRRRRRRRRGDHRRRGLVVGWERRLLEQSPPVQAGLVR